MIHAIVEARREQLGALCRRFGVRRLELFGSAASGRFDADRSDLDFLVEFEPDSPLGYSDRYFGLLWGLEELFGRRVDLLEANAIRNPYLRQSIDASRQVLYAA